MIRRPPRSTRTDTLLPYTTLFRSVFIHLLERRLGSSLLLGHGDTMTRYLLLALLAISSTASAVVIRSDVDDVRYQVPASAFPALADMPRSEERRVGKECVSQCRSRWSPYH